MGLYLKNDNLQLTVQYPGEVYQGSRFDWTGQISSILYKDVEFCSKENEKKDLSFIGLGLYNEFGINRPIGYRFTKVGGSFLKIGVGILRRNSAKPYLFHKLYEFISPKIDIKEDNDSVTFAVIDDRLPKYSYKLEKSIVLNKEGFSINYTLTNIGTKKIVTNEYVHNFLSIGGKSIGEDTTLEFSHPIKRRGKKINPDKNIIFNDNSLTFKKVLNKIYFFSKLLKRNPGKVKWCLKNSNMNISISEEVESTIESVNLWGNSRVISPEIYVKIKLNPGETKEWSRIYKIKELN